MSSKLMQLLPTKVARGEIVLPGSKSISNRVLLLSALAQGSTRLHGLLDADDTQVMRMALERLGVQLHTHLSKSFDVQNEVLIVAGGGGTFLQSQADLMMGNAGTAIRPLTAALAILGGEYHLHGVARMHERPIKDLVDGLLAIGARIDYLGQEGYPPIQIHRGVIQVEEPVRVRGDV